MAVIENAGSLEEFRAALVPMDRGELIAQQLCQRGAIKMLEVLIEEGCTAENARALLESCQHGLQVIHEVAHARGIDLVSYSKE